MKSRKSTNGFKEVILYKIKTHCAHSQPVLTTSTWRELAFSQAHFEHFYLWLDKFIFWRQLVFAFSSMTESTIFNGVVPLLLRSAKTDYSTPPSLSSTLPPPHATTSFFPPTNIPISNLFSDGRKLDHINVEISLLPAPHNRKVLPLLLLLYLTIYSIQR